MNLDTTIKEGLALQNAGKFNEAGTIYQRIIEVDPNHAEALQLLGQLEQIAGNWDAAEKLYLRSLEIDPNQFEVWTNYGALLNDLRRPEASEKALVNALALRPDYAPALKWQGALAMMRGEKEKALGLMEQAQKLNPKLVSVYAPITKNKGVLPEDPLVETMSGLLDDPVMEDDDKAALHYALAYVYERAGDTKKLFHHLKKANSLQNNTKEDWAKELEISHRFTNELMTPDFLSMRAPESQKAFTPIFIVGMPRSGSTLLEQILATNDQVFGGEELPYFLKFLGRTAMKKSGKPLPFGLDELGPEDLAEIAAMYQKRVGRLAPGTPFITDKMPWNFQFIGMIAKILPWAKVINIHRDPMDCGFSVYRNFFSSNLPQCSSFEGYARFRKMYLDNMAFWHTVLPGFVLDMAYEDLVADTEAQVRRVTDFCGLAFDDAMLDFHKTRREVRTLSQNQVLRPINKDRIGIAKKYTAQLKPLADALERYGVSA